MIIYLTAMLVFMIQCITMSFIYISKQKIFKRRLKYAYKSKTDLHKFFYFFLIPCLNEEKVIKDTLQHLLDLPGDKQIIVIDDDSDDNTIQQVNSISGPISVVERKRPHARTGKGDSLNSAMPTMVRIMEKLNLNPEDCIIGVIDADGILSGNTTYKLNDAFSDPNVDAAQLRVKMKDPRKILQTFQDIEFFVINHLVQLLRSYLHAVALCGNGQFFRFSSVYNKLGVQPWGNALLEDYELTLRMELNGLHIKYISDAYVDQEALLSVKRLIKQRARWSQGGFNCWKYFGDIIKSKIMTKGQKFDAYFFFTQPVLNILADFTIIYLTLKLVFLYSGNLEFLVISLVILAILGTFFGIVFTVVYIREITLTDNAHLVIQRSDMINERIHFKKAILSIGLISYIYVVLFFSLIISAYHVLVGQRTWDKTKRL